jgi:thiol-disulfide isomerase/thioredoxin
MEGSMNAVSSFVLAALLSAGPTDGTRSVPTPEATLLQFTSQRCQFCQAMQPIVAQLAQQGVSVQPIDVEQQLPVARQFQVSGVPTFIAVSGGREMGRIEGVTSYEKLAALAGARSQESGVRSQGAAAYGSSSGPQPPAPNALPPEQAARAATVRLKVEDATGYGFGTGTIIDTHDSEALVITCGHLFRESKGQGKVTADVFASGAAQSVEGQLIGYDLERDVALVSIRAAGMRAASVAPPAFAVRPGDRAFTIGCDKGADPSVRATQITSVNKYRGKPNYTAAGQPIDGRSGGGLFSAEGFLIGVCNAADPADNEGIYAGLASIHWQLDKIGQSEIYQRAAQVAAAVRSQESGVRGQEAGVRGQGTGDRGQDAIAAAAVAPAAPQLPPTMPGLAPAGAAQPFGSAGASPSPAGASPSRLADLAPVAAVGEDTEIVFIVRSKRDPSQRSDVYVVDQAAPDLVARITHAARASGEQRAALARAAQSNVRTAAANQVPGSPPVVRGQSAEY